MSITPNYFMSYLDKRLLAEKGQLQIFPWRKGKCYQLLRKDKDNEKILAQLQKMEERYQEIKSASDE